MPLTLVDLGVSFGEVCGLERFWVEKVGLVMGLRFKYGF